MMDRRWTPGWRHTEAGLSFRIVPGKKAPDDLRLEWYTPDGWRPVTMAVGAIMADFWVENEDVLYPPPAKGGRYYLDYLHEAATAGWTVAEGRLRAERAAKEQRQNVANTTDTGSVTRCQQGSPDGSEHCVKPLGHAGAHMASDWVWPQEPAA